MGRRLDVELGARHGGAVVDGPPWSAVPGGRCGGSWADSRWVRRRSLRRRPPVGRGGTRAVVRGARVRDVSDPQLPMFPLNTVLFPGVSVPLHVFEDRYRALVHHLLRVAGPEPSGSSARSPSARATRSATTAPSRSTGSAAGSSSPRSRRTPTAPSTSWRSGRDRIRLDGLDTSGAFPAGHVSDRPEPEAAGGQRDRSTGRRAVVHGVPGRAQRDPRRPLAGRPPPRPALPLLDAGRPRARSRCPSGRRCSRPRTPPSGWHGDRPAPRRAARHERRSRRCPPPRSPAPAGPQLIERPRWRAAAGGTPATVALTRPGSRSPCTPTTTTRARESFGLEAADGPRCRARAGVQDAAGRPSTGALGGRHRPGDRARSTSRPWPGRSARQQGGDGRPRRRRAGDRLRRRRDLAVRPEAGAHRTVLDDSALSHRHRLRLGRPPRPRPRARPGRPGRGHRGDRGPIGRGDAADRVSRSSSRSERAWRELVAVDPAARCRGRVERLEVRRRRLGVVAGARSASQLAARRRS